ncbi:hypothetical protein TTHERM_00075790 (macronuclear) [Tetrahymena thermophila SB210]|uniref:Uncharacterized protein n=1 Tax=Tetrahymena thermophila (strain SB210) TaxID=312017 RepID=Q23G86_TETTS|nr:hypothetical protein TTHERM_00075790 [Tetrahymena thermophila SB210]EAR95374.2 hypothetical protein TTHERM_00075790 [Tetrahymena thermophila SB210]|eukprot:XP_001015619.2 hypothetical protein TTHERM_00075790 [Tetrahymena thermophila SB210]
MITHDQNDNELEVDDRREIERLKLIEQSIRTKVQMLCEYHSEVNRQIMYLEKNYENLQGGSLLGDIQSQIQLQNTNKLTKNGSNVYNDNITNNYNYYQDKNDGGNIFQEDEEEYFEEEQDEEDQNELNLSKQNDRSLFQNEIIDKNHLLVDMSQMFPKLMKPRQQNIQKDEPKKKRISTLLQTKKMYPFKKMKPLPNDEPGIVCQKLAMKDKYEKFLKKLKQEMPYYISDYGQIRYPIYVKKKVAFFCRYISRTKLVEDTRIGAEAVAKWVKVYCDYMDDKLENGEPNETFEEYVKQKQTKSAYIIKKKQLNCQPNLNQAILKQVQPASWQNQENHKKVDNQKNKYNFKMS